MVGCLGFSGTMLHFLLLNIFLRWHLQIWVWDDFRPCCLFLFCIDFFHGWEFCFFIICFFYCQIVWIINGSGDWQVFMFSRVSQLRFVGVWVPRSSVPFCSSDFHVLYLFIFFSSNCGCTCAYGVCWSCRDGMATGRIMRWVLLGTKVSLIEIESSGWKWRSCSLQTGLLPAG